MSKDEKKPLAKDVKTKPVAESRNKPEFKNQGWLRDIVLGAINVLLIIGLFYLLSQLPGKADKVSELRSITLGTTANIQEFELSNYSEQITKLNSAYVGEDEILSFAKEIEKLKEGGTVVNFSFQNEDPIVDKTKSYGLPIVITLNGSWADISSDIAKIQSLPYLFRPVAFNAEEKVTGGVEVEYGGILYVNENYK